MDYNQPYQIQYNFYQNSPQQSQPQQPQQSAQSQQQQQQQRAQQNSAYFQPIQAQDTLRSMQPSPSAQSYSSLVLDMGGSPAPIHRVIVSAPQHHQRLQLLQSPSLQQNTSTTSSASAAGYFGTFGAGSGQSGGAGAGTGAGSSVDFVTETLQQFYQQQRPPNQDRPSNQDSQFFQVAQSIRQQQQQQAQQGPGGGGLFAREIAQSSAGGRPISATSRGFASQPPRIAQRPLVSSSSLFITSDAGAFKHSGENIWGTPDGGNLLVDEQAANLKTPMALIVDLARRHKVGVSYQTTSERYSGSVGGAKIYTVCLQLGDEQHFGIGNSIPRAQQNAAQEALRSSSYVSSSRIPRPPHPGAGGEIGGGRRAPGAGVGTKVTSGDPNKPPQSENKEVTAMPKPQVQPPQPNNREASMTATVELNALAMKYRLRVVYEDHQMKRPVFVNGRQTMAGIFVATCKIGNNQFVGEGQTRKDARQASAKAALESLKSKTPDELLAFGIGTPPNLQSEVSQIYDFAARRGLSVRFNVEIDQPLPDQTFLTTCILGGVDGGELAAIGRGKSKKEAKQKACIEMLQKIRHQVPSMAGGKTGSEADGMPLSIIEAIRASGNTTSGGWRPPSRRFQTGFGVQQMMASRKQPAADAVEPNYLLDLNPISRLFQIYQAIKNGILPTFFDEIPEEKEKDKEKEPEKEKLASDKVEPSENSEIAEKPAEKPAAVPPTLDASTKISVKPTHDGKYVLLLSTPPLAPGAPNPSVPEQPSLPKPLRRTGGKKRGKFVVRCTCGDKTVLGEGRNQKAAKSDAATEMLKLLNYNVPPPPPSPPTPPPLLNPDEAGTGGVRKGRKKRSSSGDDAAKKKQLERMVARAEAAEAASRVQLFFHPALFAPPKSKSFNPSGLLTANDLIGPNRQQQASSESSTGGESATVGDITIIAKKLNVLKKPTCANDLLKIVEEVGPSKLEKLSLSSFENEEELSATPSFVKLRLLCALAGRTPAVTHKLNNASHLVFVDLADAMFCGEGPTQNEALESVASRLVDSIASTVLQGASSAPQIILTEEDLVPQQQAQEQDEPEVLPTALMVDENNNSTNNKTTE